MSGSGLEYVIFQTDQLQYFKNRRYMKMLYWALVFFVISLIAALFGFTGIAIAFAGIAKILFFIFIVLLILTLIFGWRRRPPSRV